MPSYTPEFRAEAVRLVTDYSRLCRVKKVASRGNRLYVYDTGSDAVRYLAYN